MSPTEICKDQGTVKLLASNLKTNEHFQVRKIEGNLCMQESNTLFEGLRTMITESSDITKVAQVITKCSLKIMEKLFRCGSIRNQAELRYVVGDPIMEMLCDTFKL